VGFLIVLSIAVAVLVAIPIVILAIECLSAVLLDERARADEPAPYGPRPSAVILIPAHDEESVLRETLLSIEGQIGQEDRILVVAHNCRDRTAEIARSLGAEVFEARDEGTGGKPDALRAGLDALADDPPEVVVTLDADCTVSAAGIDLLVRAVDRHRVPAQGKYLFERPEGGSTKHSVSRLALLIKNFVRPLGLHRLGLPCLLNGSGSAFPYALLRDALRGESSIVEDRTLAIKMALEGHAPLFCPRAEVWSKLPESRSGAFEQRRRWEHGNLHLVFLAAPRLILSGLVRLRLGLIALGLDLLVPPLALVALGWVISALLAMGALAVTESSRAFGVTAGSGILLIVAVLSAAARFEGPRAVLRLLVGVPLYVAWKIPLYVTYVFRRERRWIRTARNHDEGGESA